MKHLHFLLISIFILSCQSQVEKKKLQYGDKVSSFVLDWSIDMIKRKNADDTLRYPKPYLELDKMNEIIGLVSNNEIGGEKLDAFLLEFEKSLEIVESTIFIQFDYNPEWSEDYLKDILKSKNKLSNVDLADELKGVLLLVCMDINHYHEFNSFYLDSVSFKTIDIKPESLQIFPVLHDSTNRVQLIVDSTSISMKPNSLVISKELWEKSKDIKLKMRLNQGNDREFTLKTEHNSR